MAKSIKNTRKSSKGITLSASASQPIETAEETVRNLSDGAPEQEVKLEEGFTLPTTDVAPVEPTSEETSEEPVEPVIRRHMTMGVVKGGRQNGIGAPAVNGKCHEAWRMFDSLTYYEGEGDEAKLYTPALGDGLMKAKELGLNPGNIKVEYPRWRKWNGFATVTRRAKVDAPAAPAPEVATEQQEPADAE